MGEPDTVERKADLAQQHAAVVAAVARMGQLIEQMGSEHGSRGIAEAAKVYEIDAKCERSTMWRLRLATVATLLLAALLLGAAAHAAIPDSASQSVDMGRFLLLGSISVPLLLTSAYLGYQASSHRHSAAEVQRQRNQLLTLDPYLDPLPEHARHLYRALLARRFFPRSTDELEALEDEEFPRPSIILTAVDPETFEASEESPGGES